MNVIGLAQGVVVNLFVLLGFVSLCSLLRGWSGRGGRRATPWGEGLVFGGMAVVVMLVPVTVKAGVFFDCRAGVLGAAALLGGPLTALASLPLPMLYRIALGGAGTAPGLLEMVVPAALGSICHVQCARARRSLSWSCIVSASLFAGVGGTALVVAAILLFMPDSGVLMDPLRTVLVIVNAGVSMGVLSALLTLERRHDRAVETLADQERRMLQAQKMAAVGQISRKIAHHVANALTRIFGNAQLAKQHARESQEAVRLLDQILDTVERLSKLTGELLSFSAPGALKTVRMDLGKCVLGIESILTQTLGPGIEVVIGVSPAKCRVDVDPDRIEQAILHMAVNAAEAMSNRGRLTLEVSRVTLSREESREMQAGVPESDRHKGAFARLALADTGHGMSEETRGRVFEPFFTTKPHNENAGLGLAAVYSIVRQHGGFMDVRSRLGQGTTFLMYLPIVKNPASDPVRANGPGASASPAPGAGRTCP